MVTQKTAIPQASALGRIIGRRRPHAFTLIEVLVSVGAAALVAVGIAAIFESVGKTVSAGKRVSQFNSYAALLEQQLRKDFSQMSREGILMIRQQYAGIPPGGPAPAIAPNIAVNADDTKPRPRRIDELLFFVEGDFLSAREPMLPAYVAKANAARVYYGHGAKMSSSDTSGRFGKPEPYDKPVIGEKYWVLGQDGPNKYASEWMLLRHVTLLAPVRSTPSYPVGAPPVFGFPSSGPRAADQPTQFALQPAAPSIFRQLNTRVFPLPQPGGAAGQTTIRTVRGDFAPYTQNPAFSSGLVDITSTSLSELRSLITSLPKPPSYYVTSAKWDTTGRPVEGMVYEASPTANGALDLQQQWMDQIWPTQSDPTFGPVPGVDPVPGARMRYEPVPPDYLNVLSTTYAQDEEEQYRRTDQSMLTASNFIPRCTEFIVEWSFGQVDNVSTSPTYGQVIWYGLDRPMDLDSDGVTSGLRDSYAARPYPFKTTVAVLTTAPLEVPYTRTDGKITDGSTAAPYYVVDRQLINGYGFAGLPNPATLPLTNYFGYVDPLSTAGTDKTMLTADDPTRPLPWAWPTMIRVTVTIADAKDPTIEQTYQFVIEMPDKSAS